MILIVYFILAVLPPPAPTGQPPPQVIAREQMPTVEDCVAEIIAFSEWIKGEEKLSRHRFQAICDIEMPEQRSAR